MKRKAKKPVEKPHLDPLRHWARNQAFARAKAALIPKQPTKLKLWSVWFKLTDYSRLEKLVRATTSQEAVLKLLQVKPDGIRGTYGSAEVKYITVYEKDEEPEVK